MFREVLVNPLLTKFLYPQWNLEVQLCGLYAYLSIKQILNIFSKLIKILRLRKFNLSKNLIFQGYYFKYIKGLIKK